MAFEPISLKDDTSGLVWSGMASSRYLAELQTGVIPQIVHLVLFDTNNDNAVVHEEVEAYKVGEDINDPANQTKLNDAITAALGNLPA